MINFLKGSFENLWSLHDEPQREQNESIADLITEGTIFAVLCDDDGHDFYLLKAISESIISQENESE
jgi:hypothetical protein